MLKVILITALAIASAAAAMALRSGPEPPSAVAPIAPNKDHFYPVYTRAPEGPPTVKADKIDAQGRAVTVSCVSCHGTRQPNPQNRAWADLDEFHIGLTVQHGTNSCLSCHNRDDYNSLRLADGTKVEFTDVMQLCAQCHGPQHRDYQHGSHGGMNGYWDRTRGPRTRNNCIDCHDPHAPAYVGALPAPPPRDRFLTPSHSTTHGGAHE